MIKNLNSIINKLKQIKKSKSLIDHTFMDIALDRIITRANSILDTRSQHIYGSNARSWTKTIYRNHAILENNDMNSAAIEFGIGIVGELSSVEEVKQLTKKYKYNVPSEYKDDQGRWSFRDANTGIFFRDFSGYVGKSFLYDTFVEYMQNKLWIEDYQRAFDKVMRGICR